MKVFIECPSFVFVCLPMYLYCFSDVMFQDAVNINTRLCFATHYSLLTHLGEYPFCNRKGCQDRFYKIPQLSYCGTQTFSRAKVILYVDSSCHTFPSVGS